jgi:outer membrane protein TolC
MTKKKMSAALLLVTVLTCGCAVGPNYKKPAVNTPTVYRGLTPEEAANANSKSFAEEKWWNVFQDEQLKELMKTALQQNYDLRRAGARILQAQAALGLTRSNQFPTISADTSALNERTARQKFIPAIETNTNRVGLDFNWELDFWGKFRRATEAARANLAATEWGRQEIARELVANVAGAYFTLRALDLFTGPAGFWTFGSTLAQPIFTAGRLRSNVRLAGAQEQEAVLFYKETIQGAFRDVSDGLIAYRKTQEFREQQQLLVNSAQDAARLSHMRYSGGVASYLEVLTNETNYFSAELNLVQAQLNELLALVQLYKGLGGGWEQ